jgi:hypothetical protein
MKDLNKKKKKKASCDQDNAKFLYIINSTKAVLIYVRRLLEIILPKKHSREIVGVTGSLRNRTTN